MKRNIRLKEWGVSESLLKTPKKEYSEVRDNCPVKEYAIKTNSQGFIISGNRFNYNDAAGIYFFLGDSFVESMFVDETKRFHSVLERQLWGSGEKIACYNGGYSGANSLHLLNVIVNKVVPSRPDTVFYVLPSNDAFALEVESGVWGNSRVVSPFVPHNTGFHGVNYDLKGLRSLIKSIHEVLAAFGIPVVFMTFPHRFHSFEGELLKEKFRTKNRFSATVNNRRNTNEVLRSYCKRRGVSLIDIEEIISPFEGYSQDDLHLDEGGSELLAKTIYSWCVNGK